MAAADTKPSYIDRLNTFRGYWDNDDATARQLAALGHVYDRPPLEAIEEGSRCVDCSHFIARATSVRALDGSGHYEAGFINVDFHQRRCIRLQIRIPLEPTADHEPSAGLGIDDLKMRFEKASSQHATVMSRQTSQKSSFFSLPTELRLEIYAMILPSLPEVTQICLLHRNSPRVVTSMAFEKAGPRDLSQANILRVCRKIHEEALDIIYAHTTFQFPDAKTQYLFLRQIGACGRAQLRAVDVKFHSREDALAFALLGSCPQLNSVTIRSPRRKLINPPTPIWILDGVACLLEISGLTTVMFEPCCEAGLQPSHFLRDGDVDADVLKRQLTRSKGKPSGVRWINGYPDL